MNSHSVSAQGIAFDGDLSNSWDLAVNWANDERPDTPGESAWIGPGGAWDVICSGSYSIDALTVGFDDSVQFNAPMSFETLINNENQINFQSNVTIRANLTVSGGGIITFSPASVVAGNTDTGKSLINEDNLIEGAGTFGITNLTNMSIENQVDGIFDANIAGSEMFFNTGSAASITNRGLMRATDGGQLTFSGRFDAGPFDNELGTVTAIGPDSEVQLEDRIAISGGTITSIGAGTVRAVGSGPSSGGSAELADLTIDGSWVIEDGAWLRLLGDINNLSNDFVVAADTSDSWLLLQDDTTLSGGGSITLHSGAGSGNAVITSTNTGGYKTLTNVDNEINGEGIIGPTATTSLNVINETGGLIDANLTSKTILVNTTDGNTFSNQGMVRASNGGTLELSGQFGAGGFVNSGGTILATDTDSQVLLTHGINITGGVLKSQDGGEIIAVNTGNVQHLTDVTVDGELTINNGAFLGITNSISNLSNTISINADDAETVFQIYTDTMLTGGGTINLNETGGGGEATIVSDGASGAAKTLTNVDNIIQGSGKIGSTNFTGINFVNGNDGVVEANLSGSTLRLRTTGGNTQVNNGTIRASNGATVQMTSPFSGGPFTNNGVYEAVEGSSIQLATVNLTNKSSTALNGGTYIARSDVPGQSLINLPGSEVEKIAAGTTVELQGNAAITAGGFAIGSSLITNGGNLILSDFDFFAFIFSTNSGLISLDHGAEFNIGGGPLTNTGELHGNGTIWSGGVTNTGVIRPGPSAGLYFQGGSTVLDVNGTLDIEISGSTEAGFADVNGVADLGGTLKVSLTPNSFPINVGDEWIVMHANALQDGPSDNFHVFNSILKAGSPVFGMQIRENPVAGYDVVVTALQEFLLGDVNGDGAVNLLDVQAFINAVAGGTYIAEADCNQDGVVNLLDVSPFITILAGG